MLNFFEFIAGFFDSIISFITNTLASFVSAFELIYTIIAVPPVIAGVCHPIIGASLVMVTGCAIIKFLIGR